MNEVGRRERRREFWVLLLCLFVGACGRSAGKSGGDAAESGVAVQVVRLEGRSAVLLLERSGILRGSAEVQVVPKVAGRIEEIRAVRGERVQTGDVLAVIEQADYMDGLSQARAALAVAEANLAQAELNVTRQRTLAEEGIASDAALEAAETAFRVAAAGVQQAKAAVEMAERQVDDTRIVSPIDGFVAERMVEVGTFVSPPSAAYTVVALDPMEMQLSVTDRDIAGIRVGAAVDLTVGALPGRSFLGRVTEVSVAADRTTGSFPVTVRIPNRDRVLRDGMAARAAIHTGEREDALVVSPDALIERGGQWFAYVVKDTVAESRRVRPGEWTADGVLVEEGLEEGDRLVVKGQAYLDDGTRVRVQEVTP